MARITIGVSLHEVRDNLVSTEIGNELVTTCELLNVTYLRQHPVLVN
jgi:hypothetical protein